LVVEDIMPVEKPMAMPTAKPTKHAGAGPHCVHTQCDAAKLGNRR